MRPSLTNPPGPSHSDDAVPSFILNGSKMEAPRLDPGLYVVATPIGNLRDITLRALEVLAAADLIACEDTRVTSRLLDHYGIKRPLTPYHDHNAATARPRLLSALSEGAAVALVSDAGTPLISDPGYKLVTAARAAGNAVTAAPGVSSVLTALSIAGIPTDRFWFEGFLPTKAAARQKRLAEIARIPGTLVLFETGPRLADALADLSQALGPRQAVICRELTKLHEEVREGDLAVLAAHYAGDAERRGEFVALIAPPEEAPPLDQREVDNMLRNALERGSLKDAVAEVASAIGQPRKQIYQRALALGRKPDDGET